MFAAPSIVARCQLVLTLLLLFQSSESFRSYKNELPSAPLAEVSSTASSSERQSRQWSWGSRLRGGDAKIVTARPELTYAENMVAGGLSRAAAQGICHPLNVCKTLLQARGDGAVASLPILFRTVAANPRLLTRGILAQTTLSIPNGAVSYATLECTKNALLAAVPPAVATSYRPVLDLVSSACGTLLTSLISVPQTVLLDRTMAGQYPSLGVGARRLAATEGLRGFYRGWAPAMISKIPSYALTWTFFQSAKRMHNRLTGQEATSPVANFVLGALASGLSVCVTIPMDTVKTRLTTQSVAAAGAAAVKYSGVINCFSLIIKEEGIGALYRALPPRLLSVVPMMGIQLMVYEVVRLELQTIREVRENAAQKLLLQAASVGRN